MIIYYLYIHMCVCIFAFTYSYTHAYTYTYTYLYTCCTYLYDFQMACERTSSLDTAQVVDLACDRLRTKSRQRSDSPEVALLKRRVLLWLEVTEGHRRSGSIGSTGLGSIKQNNLKRKRYRYFWEFWTLRSCFVLDYESMFHIFLFQDWALAKWSGSD